MALQQNHRYKLIYLLKILEDNTDEENGITMPEIIAKLKTYDVPAERKGLYCDLEALRNLGYNVVKTKKGYKTYYSLDKRLFTLSELKLMADAVASSRLVTARQSERLIKKITKLASKKQAKELQRNIFIYDRPKSINESVFANIGTLTEAIAADEMIDFNYLQWNRKKQLVLRLNGEKKDISPSFLEFYDGKYYLIAYDPLDGKVKHYRVDKMSGICLNGKKRLKAIDKKEQASYSAQMANMFSGKLETLKFEAEEKDVGILIDEFGTSAVEIAPLPTEEAKYICRVKLQVSNQLFGWLLGVSDKIKLTAPESVVEEYHRLLKQNLSSRSSAR